MKLTAVAVNGYGSFGGLAGREKQSQFPAAPGGSRPEGRGPWGVVQTNPICGSQARGHAAVRGTHPTDFAGLPRQTKPISRRGRANLAPPASGLPSAGCTNKAKFTGRPVPGGRNVQNEANLEGRLCKTNPICRTGRRGPPGRGRPVPSGEPIARNEPNFRGRDTPPSPKPEALRLPPPRTIPTSQDLVARFDWSLSRLRAIMAACRGALHNPN